MSSENEDIEIFIGIVNTLGTNTDRVLQLLETYLKEVDFTVKPIRVSNLLKQFDDYQQIDESFEDKRIGQFMDAGNDFRTKLKSADALSLLVINKIRELRQPITENKKPLKRVAFIFNSLKHPKEVELIRSIYEPSFFLVSIHESKNIRISNLEKKIANSHNEHQSSKYHPIAYELIQRDESERDITIYGQDVRGTYPEADLFVDSGNKEKLDITIKRFIHLFFGNTIYTPTNDEFGMFNAYAMTRRSGSLARQVGASIINNIGELISVGTNEIPKFGGGQQTGDQNIPLRNLDRGYDPNDQKKINVIVNLINTLKDIDLLKESNLNSHELISRILPKLKQTYAMNLIEFTTEVHAEMAAIVSAARNTLSVNNSMLYTTTFPCHDCTKHIIAAGIQRVVYIEPYPKSQALELFSEFISVDQSHIANRLSFEPFVGIAPRGYLDFFGVKERKNSEGVIKKWDSNKAVPRFRESYKSYLIKEHQAKRKLQILLGKRRKINICP
jgi:deoxycytidylate deaminase